MAPTRWNDPLTSVSAVSRQETLQFHFFVFFGFLTDGDQDFCDGCSMAATTSVSVCQTETSGQQVTPLCLWSDGSQCFCTSCSQ